MLADGGGDGDSEDEEEEEEENSEDHNYDNDEEEATVVVDVGVTENLDSVRHAGLNTGGVAGGDGVDNTDGDETSEDETSSASSSSGDDDVVVEVIGAVEGRDNTREDPMKAYLLSMFGPDDPNDNGESRSAEVVREGKMEVKDEEARKDEEMGEQEEEEETVKLQEQKNYEKEQNEEVEEIAIIVEARRTLAARDEQQR
jgi:hypothetical protein